MHALELIYKAVDEVNAQNPEAPQIAKSAETTLLDSKGGIDSLALLNLVVAIEQVVFDETKKSVSVADESVFSSPENPLRTIGSLATRLDELMKSS
jgi:acyl carrier protein